MAKSKAQAGRVPEARPRRASRQAQAERWNHILIIGGVVAVILVAAGLIGFGWYQTQIKPLGKTVLQVGHTTYSLAALERRMTITLRDNPSLKTNNQFLAQLPDITLADLEREAKLLESSSKLGITLTDEDVAAQIRSTGSLAADVEAKVYAAEYQHQLKASGLPASEFERMLRGQLLDTKVRNYYTFFAPGEEPQVRGRYTIFDDQTKAQEALVRLQAGENFATVANDLSAGAASGQPYKALDWTPRTSSSTIPTSVQDFLFGAQANQLSDVISDSGAFYIALLEERDDHRALDAKGKQRVSQRELDKWLTGLDATLVIKRNLSLSDSARALSDVLNP